MISEVRADGRTGMKDNLNNEPICKFGPGGDYVSVWPGRRTSLPVSQTSRLTRLLGTIAEMLGTAIQAEFCPSDSNVPAVDTAIFRKDGPLSEHEGICNRRYAPTNKAAKGPGGLRTQPLLFGDDAGIGRRARHKTQHRIRTHRRFATKRSAHSLPRQGSLFEADRRSKRIA